MNEYTCALLRIIDEYAEYIRSGGGREVETVSDVAAGHFILLQMGWDGLQRVYGVVIHVDVRDGKFWVQHDTTEEGVANDLVAAGVPRDLIVLAFKPPDIRPYTEFAAA